MTFYETLTAAVADVLAHGFDSQRRIDRWMEKIQAAAKRSWVPARILDKALRATFTTIYQKLVTKGRIVDMHPGVSTFTIHNVKPALRAELERRLLASANLIKLNREQAIQETLRRFSGWSSSVPAGGSDAQSRAEVKKSIYKSIGGLDYVERRVLIDQGHKFTAALNDIMAKDGGALAAVWHSHWRQTGYHYREDHKERDEVVYPIRDSWAAKKGLVKRGPRGWFDEITQPAEEVYCRCYASYVYSLGALPEELLTQKGRDELERVRKAMAE